MEKVVKMDRDMTKVSSPTMCVDINSGVSVASSHLLYESLPRVEAVR